MKLIYDWDVSGHHVEYLKHLITFIKLNPDRKADFIFIINNRIVNFLDEQFLRCINIHFIEKKVVNKLNKISSLLFRSYLEIKYIKKFLESNKSIDQVLFLNLDYLQPALCFLKICPDRKVFISGILFNPYSFMDLYSSGNYTLRQKISQKRKYLQIKQSTARNNFENIYILNDKKGVEHLNHVFTTSIFKYLPDPVDPDKNGIGIHNFFSKFNINFTRFKLLLLGSLNSRKNVINLLKALAKIKKPVLEHMTFLIIGKAPLEKYRRQIIDLIDEEQNLKYIQIVFYDRYISVAELNTAFQISDLVLMPYLSFYGSSGIIGHAAKHNKPVIGSDYGLVSVLINEYKLGSTVNPHDIKGLAGVIEKYYVNSHDRIQGEKYLEDHQPVQYASILLTEIPQ